MYLRVSFCIRAVDSRNRVSVGGSLWKTTLEIDDLPLLHCLLNATSTHEAKDCDIPSLAH